MPRAQTGVVIGGIERPSIFKSNIFPVVALAVTAGGAYLGYNLYYAEFMKNTALWTFGTVLVFWFAVSGGMHNIIRGVPMYYVEQGGGRVQLFLPQVGPVPSLAVQVTQLTMRLPSTLLPAFGAGVSHDACAEAVCALMLGEQMHCWQGKAV